MWFIFKKIIAVVVNFLDLQTFSVSLQNVIEENTSLKINKMKFINDEHGSKNSLNDVVDILGHLQDLNFIQTPMVDNNKQVEGDSFEDHFASTENPLGEVIDGLKQISATIEIKDSDTSMQVSETIENIVDIYNGNEEIHLIEEEENRNMFAVQIHC